ncbi:restriction endonuclease subunit S, partial [Bifidobacterium adolescentis]|uniref:restriction endonuclease subunit S n=1 Tax=Bifidobacterium adolescentis TaxID=1680 RepID=UPI0015F348BE
MAEQHEKALVPQIRFTGFTDPWEQRKLGELFEESDERASDREILSVSVANGIYPASESDRETNPGASLANYKVVHSGDVVYNSMRMWQGAVDASRYDGIVSPAYVVAKPNSEVYARFFARLLRQPMLLKQYQQVSQGNSKDTQVLKFDDFASIEISMPASENEQRRIGAFFDRLDSLITLHQRKYDKLCVLKKSMLDKMFPKGGSLYPEIRFAGFTDPWEQRKLGDILQERNIRTSDFEGNPIFSLTIEDGVTPKTDRYERTSLITKTEDLFKIVSPNEFVTNPMNLRFGAFGYNKNSFSVCVSGYYDVFSIDNDKCSGFWSSYFKTPIALKRFDDAATGSLIEKRRVKFSTLCQLVFLMPEEMKEKKQIAAFFDRLDSLITLHQRK